MLATALVLGESLVDIVLSADGATTERPGGSAANVALALARLDRDVRLATACADDERGRSLKEHLAVAGVQLATDPHVLDRTSTACATIGSDGSATYEFDLEWRLGPLVEVTGERPLLVHTCSLGAVVEPGAAGVRSVVGDLRDVATVSYDVNARPAVTGAGPEIVGRVEDMVALADVVKASDEDLAELWPDRSMEDAARHLLGLGPLVVAVTRGMGGAAFWTRTTHGSAPSVAVTVADTIGAGDTFMAGTVDALWARGLLGADRREDLAALDAPGWAGVLEHAAEAAAVTVSRRGADPPYRHELPA